MNRRVRITAPSRLHFGLLRFSQQAGLSFGGLGMMIDVPRIIIELAASEKWHAEGPLAERALSLAQRIFSKVSLHHSNALHLRVVESPPEHTGLGTGTQLSLSLALAVNTLCEASKQDIVDLAQLAGRGARSAVGSYGFQSGGLVWETGRLPGQTLGELANRLPIPDLWRILLITPRNRQGMSGPQESSAFEMLPPVPAHVTHQLQHIAETEILPAVEQENFASFAEAVFQYGHLAGSQFAPVQGGVYASPQMAVCVERLREAGVAGVSQSSWGPTIFAFAPDANEAAGLLQRLQTMPEFGDTEMIIAAPDNRGVRVEQSAVCLAQDLHLAERPKAAPYPPPLDGEG